MRFVPAFLLSIALTFTTSCGSSGDAEEKDQNSVTTDDTTSDTTTTTDQAGTGTDTDNSTDPDMAAYAERICNRINTCMAELTCSQPIELDIPGCVAQFLEQGVTEEDAANWENNSCANINEIQCNDQTVQDNCECPEAPQANCPDGFLCNIALQGGQYACGDATGTIPTDAPECNAQTPCPDQDNNQVCVTTSADAENGQCIYLCDR